MKYLFRKRRWQLLIRLLDGCGHILSGFPSGHKHLPKNIRSILVVRLDHLGDLVRASAIPQLVKEAYPEAKLIFLTNRAGAELIEGNPYVDDVVVFDPRWYQAGSRKAGRSGDSYGAVIRRLKDLSIDLALLPRGDIRENLLAKMAGIPHRVGYGVTGGGFLLSRLVQYRESVHEDDHTMDIVRAIGVEVKVLRPRIYASPSSTPQLNGDWIGIQLEAGTPAKEWSLGRKQEFLEACEAELSHKHIYFIGQNREFGDCLEQRIAAKKDLPWINLIGKTSVADIKALLAKTRVFVGFDSGPTHMAASLGLPTLFIYSGTNDFEVWKPLAEHATVLKNKVDCSPCHLTKCNVAGHPCLEGVSSARVMDWIKERL